MDEPAKKERVLGRTTAGVRERVVLLLREMAQRMREAGDRTRAGAYTRAADNVERRMDFDELYDRKRLRAITGIGPSIERTIVAFLERDERPAWLDDASKLPQRIAGGKPGRVRGGAPPAAPPEDYADAPFADAPDLHVHTSWSDGTMSVEEVVVWARRLGARAVGITDHSGSLRIANGLRPNEVRAQWKEIERVQAEHPDILILRGTECDILRNGRLDHPEELLAEFDFVVASLHSQLKLDKAAQTLRVLRALDSEHMTVLGHPTTRVPNARPRANLDLDRVFAKAAERGIAMEVNGNPGRIDLDVPLARRALAAGCALSVSSDGHSAREMLSFAKARWMALEAGATEADLVNYSVMGDARPPRRAGRLTRP